MGFSTNPPAARHTLVLRGARLPLCVHAPSCVAGRILRGGVRAHQPLCSQHAQRGECVAHGHRKTNPDHVYGDSPGGAAAQTLERHALALSAVLRASLRRVALRRRSGELHTHGHHTGPWLVLGLRVEARYEMTYFCLLGQESATKHSLRGTVSRYSMVSHGDCTLACS
jgi:hypothetical protein